MYLPMQWLLLVYQPLYRTTLYCDLLSGQLIQLLKSDVSGVLTEALTADIKMVLPDHAMSVAAGPALPGPGAVLPWAGEPNVVVTHPDFETLSLVEVNQAIK